VTKLNGWGFYGEAFRACTPEIIQCMLRATEKGSDERIRVLAVNFLNSHVEGVSTIPGVHKSDPPELRQAITEQALSWKQKNFDFSFWTDSIFLENGYATQQNNQNLKMKITNDAD
jgi:hypothetical protein